MAVPGRRPATGPRPGPALTLGVFVVIGIAIGTGVAVGQRPALAPSPTRFVPPTGSAGALPPPVTGTPSSGSGGQPLASGSVRIDPSLLTQLPSTVSGTADLSTSDVAVASVVRLKPGVYSDEYFRSWRETFDTGACSQAGGVAGSAESVIAGRRTFIGHCAGGVFTYHVYLPAGAAIVSISSLGERRLGERIVEGIR